MYDNDVLYLQKKNVDRNYISRKRCFMVKFFFCFVIIIIFTRLFRLDNNNRRSLIHRIKWAVNNL